MMVPMETRTRQCRRRNSIVSAVMNSGGSGGTARTAGRRRVVAGVLAAVAGVCLGVGAGVVPAVAVPGPVVAAPAVAAKAAVPEGLESFYSQKVEWYDCGATGGMERSAQRTGFQCAKVKVPLDYSKPDGQTIEVAMKKHLATGSVRQGSLFINPGGPGGSGVQYVEGAVDPMSDPGQASSGAPFEELASQIETTFRQMEANCAAGTKPAGLLDHVDTISVARDLDVLRALSGDQRLNYLGISYGTYLGAHYAELFPANTGRMVLDGTLDPSISLYERQAGAMKGLERALRTYVDWCQAGQGCPLTGGTDAGVQQVRDLFASVDRSPLSSSDPNRPVTGSEIRMAVMYSLYGDEQSWSGLSSSLDEAINQRNGALIRQITDQTVADVANTAAVRAAITCLDYPVDGDMAVWSARHEEIRREAPTFGDSAASADLGCQAWGHNGTRQPAPIHAKGAAPILVVGSTGDPATPYEWARSLSEQLETGHLLTREGNGHTAYGRAAACTKAVDTFLLSGELPPPGQVCRGEA